MSDDAGDGIKYGAAGTGERDGASNGENNAPRDG